MSYSDEQIAKMKATEARSQLLSAQALSMGGPEWTVTRTTGNGIDEDVVKTTHTVNPCWFFLYRPKRRQNDGTWVQPDDEWRFRASSGTDLQPQDLVQSTAVPTLQFQIITLDTPEGYIAGTAERIVG